ncbi:C-type lectin domain family 2 member B-like isoform 2-T2 [Discoglossus pictus]
MGNQEKTELNEEERREKCFMKNLIYHEETKQGGAWKRLQSKRTPLVWTICISVVLILVIIALAAELSSKNTIIHHLWENRTRGDRQQEDAPPARCEDGWKWHKGKCYYFSNVIAEWDTSRILCASRNASLALIDTQEELEFLRQCNVFQDHWIGLCREGDGKPWVWTNGTLFNNMFPIEGVSPCVFLNTERVASAACYGDRKWVCSKLDTNAQRSHFY